MECRQCSHYCDKVIQPRECIRLGCSSLYAYDDELSGRRFFGCVHKVFGVEIDSELFEEADRTRLGWGAVKVTGTPLPHCPLAVETAYSASGARSDCVNRPFFDDAAFDVRNL